MREVLKDLEGFEPSYEYPRKMVQRMRQTLKQWHTLACDTYDDLHCGVECGVNGEGYIRARVTMGKLLKEIEEVLR
jgi:4-hydroxy-3-methylbut-2-en-1-yl diphosphate synthase IspG/GcpE